MADVGGRPDKIPAKFSRFNFAVKHNPLHLGISKSASNSVLGEKFDNYAIVSLIQSGVGAGERGRDGGVVELFVCLHILSDELVRRSISLCQVSESPGTLTLYASERFHRHYRIADSEDVFIRLVKAFPLTKVVFGARSTRCYEWARNRLFSTELLVSTCQQKVLVRSGDEFLAPVIHKFSRDETHSLSNYQDLVTLACEPVMQGIISVNTSIVITQIDDSTKHSKGERFRGKEETAEKPSRNSFCDGFPEPLIISEFACQKDVPNVLYLRPVIIPKILTHLTATVNRLTCTEDQCETELRVGITKATLVELGALNGSWVILSIPRGENCGDSDAELVEQPESVQPEKASQDDETSPEGKQVADVEAPKTTVKESAHLAQVFVIDQKQFGAACDLKGGDGRNVADASYDKGKRDEEDELYPDDNVVFLSPRLWFNLQHHPSRLIQPDAVLSMRLAKTELQHHDSILASSKSISTSCQPPLAKEVHLGLVKSPDYPMTSKFDQAIKKYFTETRIISLGDLVTLSTKEFPEYTHDIGEGIHTRYPFIYFKVIKIEPLVEGAVSYMVDSLHSAVFQGVPVSSCIPATIDAYSNSKLDPIWGSPSPAGIWKYANQVEDLIIPYLTPKSQCNRLAPSVLLSGPTGCGKVTVVRSVCRRLNLHCVVANCHSLCADTTASTEAKIKNLIFKGGMCAPCVLVMRNIHVLARDRDGTGEDPRVAASLKEAIQSLTSTHSDFPVVVVATAPTTKAVLTDLHACFLHHVEMKVPNEQERTELLQALSEKVSMATDVDIAYIAKRTAGLVLGDLCALLSHTFRSSMSRVISSCSVGSKLSLSEESDLCTAGVQVNNVDFENALNQLQAAHADAIGAPKIPSVLWEDIGGLMEVRAQILDTIQLPLQHPELFSAGLRRSGVLLYGPPGTGKTLLAKAVATECSLNFLSIKGPELINMYVGQSEENVREVFVRARSASPCVIFFDELDSLAPNRGRSGDSGGVMDRVVSQLLAELDGLHKSADVFVIGATNRPDLLDPALLRPGRVVSQLLAELDGLHKSADVFVIGATNRPDLLDPALLRPGRFDKLLYLGVSQDRNSQVKIIRALTRKFTLSTDVTLELIAENCPLTMTGADFYALCSDAMLNAVKRKVGLLQSGDSSDETGVVVEEQDFLLALESLVPSVSEQELLHYQHLQAQICRGF